MAPEADGEGSGPEESESEHENPMVLRAALKIVKRKKADAVENEEYQQAARLHHKMQDLEAKLRSHGLDPSSMPDSPRTSGEAVAPGTRAAESTDRAAEGGGGASASDSSAAEKVPAKRSLLAAPNPFRTAELLQRSGYSKVQAYGLMAVLYIVVLAVEMVLLYVGWQFMGSSGGGDGDEGIDYEEF